MFAILISWFTITYITISWGTIFTDIYNKFCKIQENYNIPDSCILGVCFITITLPLSSLFLPSNHYVLAAYIFISSTYWLFNKEKLKQHVGTIRSIINKLSIVQIILLSLLIVATITTLLFTPSGYDQLYYHYQHIRWNEEYRIIPGLGNIEDRFGFNSNYFLISAIFTFRFLFGDATYLFQSTLFVIILCWIIVKIFTVKNNFIYLISLAFMLVILCTSNLFLADSSTDIIPIIFIFYYAMKTTITPQWYKSKTLLAFILPISLITFKLSTAIFALISLGICIYILKNRNFKQIIFLLISAFLIIGLWCIRNIISTGYLVYPINEIDIFTFDWKMPKAILILQKYHILKWAEFVYDFQSIYWILDNGLNGHKLLLFTSMINFALFLFSLIISPFIIIYSIIRKKKIDIAIYCIYFVLIIAIIHGFISAPDFRFMNGYIFGCSLLLTTFLFQLKKSFSFKITYSFTFIILICFFILSIRRTSSPIEIIKTKYEDKSISSILIRPWTSEFKTSYTPYPMGGFDIYISKDPFYRTNDNLPSTSMDGLPFNPFSGNKLQSILTIEARGNKIEDGFKTKKEYVDILNNNIEQYKIGYDSIYRIKYESFLPIKINKKTLIDHLYLY
ncbi:hypothetical protein JGH11_12985 [Dysgonomonas sp. Marseille-P4677]|uniref:LIC_10190 family membrane protein n=1 Tax=Dysgonomonas sp. Marseille-P4677 TaxID=2364790 RepID=UPI0019120168|nr:hypothetical protein [Dysgonomonas sp. Marseille-P4677]MBK5721788.1 hypothetical protein [Dysgonomonas sp. Marseille-P4677]